MFEIAFKKSVFKDLKRIDKAVLKRIFDKLENDLLKRPEDFPELKGKFAGLRKYRVGDYRNLCFLVRVFDRYLTAKKPPLKGS